MSKLSYLLVRLIEYQVRYETETYHPELDNLLDETIGYLHFLSEFDGFIKTIMEEKGL